MLSVELAEGREIESRRMLSLGLRRKASPSGLTERTRRVDSVQRLAYSGQGRGQTKIRQDGRGAMLRWVRHSSAKGISKDSLRSARGPSYRQNMEILVYLAIFQPFFPCFTALKISMLLSHYCNNFNRGRL